MNKQTPAEGIMSLGRWNDAHSFRIECDCSNADHDVVAWIEVSRDRECKTVDVEFFVEGTTPFWQEGFSRVRAAWNMLVHGYHREQHCLILRGQAARNFAAAIETSVQELEGK